MPYRRPDDSAEELARTIDQTNRPSADSQGVANLLHPHSKIDTPLSLLVARMDSTTKKSF